jgi:hypothetical protein
MKIAGLDYWGNESDDEPEVVDFGWEEGIETSKELLSEEIIKSIKKEINKTIIESSLKKLELEKTGLFSKLISKKKYLENLKNISDLNEYIKFLQDRFSEISDNIEEAYITYLESFEIQNSEFINDINKERLKKEEAKEIFRNFEKIL